MTKKELQDKLNEAWCKYMGKCSTEIMQALAFALRWCDEHPHWISVEDELPRENVWVITCNGNGSINLLMRAGNGEWYDKAVGRHLDITHWMHLPALPSNSEIPNNPGSYKDNEQGFQDAVGEACKWLYNNAPMGIHSEDWNELVEQFRKAMKRGASNETHRTHTAT